MIAGNWRRPAARDRCRSVHDITGVIHNTGINMSFFPFFVFVFFGGGGTRKKRKKRKERLQFIVLKSVIALETCCGADRWM